MTYLKITLVVLTILCCNYEVHSDPNASLKEYNFGPNRVIIGNTHIYKTKWVYALCNVNEHETSAVCHVRLEKNVLSKTESTNSCPVNLESHAYRGRIDIIGIEPFGEDKVIFTWQELNYDSSKYVYVTVEEISMRSCGSVKQNLRADNRDDLKPQIFIIPQAHSYTIVFRSQLYCNNAFCKRTIYEDGTVSRTTAWFHSNELIHALYSFNDHTNMIMLITEKDNEYNYYHLIEHELKLVASAGKSREFAWSTTNGVISLCKNSICRYVHRNGESKHVLTLRTHVSKYAALINLPNKSGHLAVICDSDPDSNYRIVKIGTDGKEKLSLELQELPCSKDYKYMTGHFYEGNEDEYCLSLFHSQPTTKGWFSFRTYCFPINNGT